MRWTNKDQEQAMQEGWAIFNHPKHAEIQKDDEAAVFASDEDAVSFIVERALAGSAGHAKALVLHFTTLAK